jgi:hypothetical protein
VIEVRSYRRVFDLERRIYSIDRFRLNPGGLPVRGAVYFVLLLVAALVMSDLPLVGLLLHAMPWPFRDLLGPGALAAVLSLIRVDGRTFHFAAGALLRFAFQPRRLDGLKRRSTIGDRWQPQPLTMFPDGSDGRLRRLRYEGPGTVLIMVEHRLNGARERARRLPTATRRSVRLSARADSAALPSGKVLALEHGAALSVSAKSESASR